MKIAVPLSDENFGDNLKLCKEKRADIIELRVDLFKNRDADYIKERIEEIKRGRNVVVTTPTASGKSLIYYFPILMDLIEEGRENYIDVLKKLKEQTEEISIKA